MERILVDTNILLRLSDDGSSDQSVAEHALSCLRLRGDVPCFTPQNIDRVLGCRNASSEGKRLRLDHTASRGGSPNSYGINFLFSMILPRFLPTWLMLVETHDVKGKNVHDTRLVAVMMIHSITHLLTFNTDDFRRFPNIILMHPNEVA